MCCSQCRDKPGSLIQGGRPPPLAFSYTTGRPFSDIPLPDYTYWSLPYADLPPWPDWLSFTRARENQWSQKLDKMIWVGSPTNPLRQSFQRCAVGAFGERLVHRMPNKEEMHELAWRCKPTAEGVPCPTKPHGWTPLQEQCRYRYILHLPGISDWLEHFKHQLSCGSLNIYVTEEREQRRRDLRQEAEIRPPLTPPIFEHFDWWAPLLQAGVHLACTMFTSRCRSGNRPRYVPP